MESRWNKVSPKKKIIKSCPTDLNLCFKVYDDDQRPKPSILF